MIRHRVMHHAEPLCGAEESFSTTKLYEAGPPGLGMGQIGEWHRLVHGRPSLSLSRAAWQIALGSCGHRIGDIRATCRAHVNQWTPASPCLARCHTEAKDDASYIPRSVPTWQRSGDNT